MSLEDQAKGVKVILDPGSTHMRKKEYAKELIEVAAKAKADAIKFQLFPSDKNYTDAGNVPLPYEWFTELYHYGKERGIDVTASAFDYQAVNLIAKHAVPFVKFAYSQQGNVESLREMLGLGKTVIVTSDTWNVGKVIDSVVGMPDKLVLLWTYTVTNVVQYGYSTELNFSKVFDRFHGFSDHSLDDSQAIKAVKAGAKWIEKHFTLSKADISCPDKIFSLNEKEIRKFVDNVKAA